jgi:cadmium resistance protein CadD (predicted permease)
MESFAALPGLAIALFATTNVDDLLVLAGFFADRSYRTRDVVAGQYLGVVVLFAASVVVALLALVIPREYVGLLGIFPILIGAGDLWKLHRAKEDGEEDKAAQPETGARSRVATVALVTMANGGDNLGIYVPAFAVRSGRDIAVIALVFVAMTAFWCATAHWMVNHPGLGAPIRKYAPRVAPVVLIALGLLILYEAGTLHWLT